MDQHDRLVARNAEAPELLEVDHAAVAHGARRAVGQDGGEVLQGEFLRRVDAQVAQPHLRQGGGHAGGALHVHRLHVAVDVRHQRLGVLGRRGDEGHARGGAGLDAQAHAQAGDRVQAVDRRAARIQRLRIERWHAERAVAPDEGAAVGHAVDRQQLRIGVGHEMRHRHGRIAVQPRPARQQQGAQCRLPARLDEQVGEGRMGFIGLGEGENRLEVRDQLQLARLVAGVVQRHGAQFGIVLGADQYRDARLQPRPARFELHLVGQKAGPVAPAVARCRQRGQGGQFAPVGKAQIEEGAVAIAQRIVAPAAHVRRAPAAHAGAVGAQRNGVAPVGQQVRRLQAARCRLDHARLEHRCRVVRLRFGRRARVGAADDLARRALVQQRLVRLHQRRGAEPAARRLAAQHVAQRHQRHALVVRHEVAHHAEVLALGLARGGEIDGVEEAELAACAERFQQAQIASGCGRQQLRRQHARVGRDHTVGRRCAAQREPRHTEGRVLVGERMVLREIGRLRDAPGQVLRVAERLLCAHGRQVGCVQQPVHRLGHHQRRHQVLEHRARP